MEGEARIEYMRIEEVPFALQNPKDHDIGEIVASIRRFGYVDPGMVDERTGRLLRGNGRKEGLMQMKASGERMPKGLKAEGTSWLWPVIRGLSSKDDDEANAYIIADNRLVEIGGWDDKGLAVILSDLRAKGDDMLVGIGYDGDDIDELWRRLKGQNGNGEGSGEEEGEGGDGKGIDERIDEIKPEYDVKEGQIWQIGKNFVACGDCRDQSTWERLFDQANILQVDGIFTSPPYAEQRKGKYPGIPPELYVEWFGKVQKVMREGLAGGGSFLLNIKPNVENGERLLYVLDLVAAMKKDWGWAFIDEYCWLRNPPPGSWPNRFKNGFEPVYHFGLQPNVKFRPDNVKGEKAGEWNKPNGNVNTGGYYHTANSAFEWDGSLPSNVIDVRANAGASGHTAAFPIDLPRFFIKAFSDEGDVWIDPFLGSGSTIIACNNERRIGLGIELVPELASIAVTRIAKAIAVKAVPAMEAAEAIG